jgi:hypothetical protein
MVQIESLRLRYFPFAHRLTLRLMFSNRWKVSNLSNTCPLRIIKGRPFGVGF